MSRSRRIPWWIRPFVGSFVALVGAFLACLVVAVPIGRAIGRGFGEATAAGFGQAFDRWVPPDRTPDLDVAPGAPGYLTTLAMAGRQLHFHDRDAGVTSIAVEAWLDANKALIVVGRYDGPPTATLAPALVRPLEPILPMLVVRVGGASDLRWAFRDGPPRGPLRAEAGELNLVVLPGKVALWTGDGPRREVDVGWHETVWCTLDAAGLAIDRRR